MRSKNQTIKFFSLIILNLYSFVIYANNLIPLYLEVYLNNQATNLIVPIFIYAENDFYISPEELSELGINPTYMTLNEAGLIDLFCQIGIKTNYDAAQQILNLKVAPHLLETQKIAINANKKNDDATKADFGSALNYHFYSAKSSNHSSLAAAFEGRIFGNFGLFSTNHTLSKSSGQQAISRRLDTYFSFNDEQNLLNYKIGDFITSDLNWMRSNRLAGVQIRRNFKLNPSLITIPLLADYQGTAAVPSSLELYLNETLYDKRKLKEGPYQITDLPTLTGRGNTKIVVTDVLGQQKTVQNPFYISAEQLGRGLSDFALQLGFARRFYGTNDNNYASKIAAIGSVRYGLNNHLTLETEAQSTKNFHNLGLGGVISVFDLAAIHIAAAKSDYLGIKGRLNYLSFETNFGALQIYANNMRSFKEFNDVASVTAQTPKEYLTLPQNMRSAQLPQKSSQIIVGFSGFASSSINLSYMPQTSFNGDKSRLIAFSINQNVHKYLSLNLNFSKNLLQKHSNSLVIGASIPLGSQVSSQATSYHNHKQNYMTYEVSKIPNDTIGSFGWRARQAEQNQMFGASYLSKIAKFEGSAENQQNHTSASFGIHGGLTFMSGEFFAASNINDAFAIVDAGAPNIKVSYENRLIGYTDAKGKILLPNLRSYENNLISIDPLNMPLDAKVELTSLNLKPKERSGIIADFKVLVHNKTALISVIDANGAYIAVGTNAVLNGQTEYMVGYDGLLFLEDIKENNQLKIKLNNKQTCTAQFKANSNNIIRTEIYNLICR